MHVREQKQLNPVQDEVLALTAVVRPILAGTLYALKADIVQEAGGYENLKLKMLPRLYRAGDGDCGICFEYAVHEAISRGDGSVLERMTDAAKLCRLEGNRPKSILFGLEKSGTQQLIDTAANILTDNSRLLYGTRGRPANLRRHLQTIAGAFRNRNTRPALPYSIRGTVEGRSVFWIFRPRQVAENITQVTSYPGLALSTSLECAAIACLGSLLSFRRLLRSTWVT